MSAAAHVARLRGVRLPTLARDVWVVQAGMLLSAIGTGVVMPFLIIYLHDVRSITLPAAGLVAGSFAVAGLAATFAAGPAIDRFGDRRVLVGSLALLAAGYASLGFATAAFSALACLSLAGLGNGALWPAQSVLLLRLVPREQRHVAFSLNRVSGNAGIALGALVGGALVAGGGARAFELIFLIDGASFAVFAMCILAVALPPAEHDASPAPGGSYRAVLRDRTYLRLLTVNVLFVVCGFATLEAAVPYFAKHAAGTGAAVIGALFVANAIGVVVLQLPIAQAVEGTRRTRTLALAGAVWAGGLLLVPLSPVAGPAALLLAGATIAVAECLHGATLTPLAAELAPAHLRGRYLGLVTSSFAVGFGAGPPLAGLLLGLSPYAVWPVVACGCLLAAAIALGLERRIPAASLFTPQSS